MIDELMSAFQQETFTSPFSFFSGAFLRFHAFTLFSFPVFTSFDFSFL